MELDIPLTLNLLRKIAQQASIEKPLINETLHFDGYPDWAVLSHVTQLKDMGFLRADVLYADDEPNWMIAGLTDARLAYLRLLDRK